MKDRLKITFILLTGIILSASPYLPANPTTTAMLAAVARKNVVEGGGGDITLTHLTNDEGTSDPGTTASISPTASEILVMTGWVSATGGGSTSDANPELVPTGPTGITWTLQGYQTYGGRRAVYLWTGTGASPSSGTVSIDFTSDTASTFESMKWSIEQGTNIDTTTPVSNYVETSADSAGPATVTITGTVGSGDWTFAAVGYESDDTLTAEAGWTVLFEDETGTGVRSNTAIYDDTATIDQTPSVTLGSSGGWGILGVILEKAP